MSALGWGAGPAADVATPRAPVRPPLAFCGAHATHLRFAPSRPVTTAASASSRASCRRLPRRQEADGVPLTNAMTTVAMMGMMPSRQRRATVTTTTTTSTTTTIMSAARPTGATSGGSGSAAYLDSLGNATTRPAATIAETTTAALRGGGGDGGGGGSSSRGSGGGGAGAGDGAGEDPGAGGADENALLTMLADNGLALGDLPRDIVQAYQSGLVGAGVLINFLHARSSWISRLLMGTGTGMRNRFLADRLFLLKIAIEEGLGLAGKLSAEYERRRENFFREGEFVFANVISALLADFALVYLPAPSVALTRTSARSSWLTRLATELPSNVFQTDRAFTLAQRAGGFALKGFQLFAVGFVCCAVGATLTNGLVYLRERFDKSYKPATEKTNVIAVSALYAIFLGLSSGSRYQLVNGIESHIFPKMFAKTPHLLEQAATFLLRYWNTFWGSQQWVIFCRLTNVQKSKPALE